MNFNGRQSDVLGTRTTFPAFVFHYCFAPSKDRKRKRKTSGVMLLKFSFSLENLVCATLFMITPLPAFHI